MNDYFVFIRAQNAFFPVDWMCQKLAVSRASHFRRPHQERPLGRDRSDVLVEAVSLATADEPLNVVLGADVLGQPSQEFRCWVYTFKRRGMELPWTPGEAGSQRAGVDILVVRLACLRDNKQHTCRAGEPESLRRMAWSARRVVGDHAVVCPRSGEGPPRGQNEPTNGACSLG